MRTLGLILNMLTLAGVFVIGWAGWQGDTSPGEQGIAILEAVLLGAPIVCNLYLLTRRFAVGARNAFMAAVCVNGVLIAWGAYYCICEFVGNGFSPQLMLFILPFSAAAVSIAAVAPRAGASKPCRKDRNGSNSR